MAKIQGEKNIDRACGANKINNKQKDLNPNYITLNININFYN